MFKKAIGLISFITLSFLCAAQREYKGYVEDATTGERLADVNLRFGRQGGTSSDKNGFFILNLPLEVSQISVSFVGYETQQITLGDSLFLTIRLNQDTNIQEVVVTALGLERATRNLGYTMQSIEGKEFSKVKSSNFLDNFAGRVAGIAVNAGSSGVGSTSKITIRGESSFTNSSPLFVVDGIPVDNSTTVNITDDAAEGFQEVDFGNAGMDINPDDIEKLSILKGPSAAALYGARAANGVILIQTKKGESKKEIQVSFHSTFFVESPFRLPKFQNSYGQGNKGEFEYKNGLGAGINDNISYSYGPRLDAGLQIPQFDSPVYLADGKSVRGGDIYVHGESSPITPTPFVSHPDNLKDFYQTGYTTINNLAFSGGSKKSTYRLSLTNLDARSFIPGVNLVRHTLSASVTFNPVARLSVTSNFNYVRSSSDNRPATKYGSENTNYAIVAWLGRQTNIGSLKQYWQPGLENVQQFSYNYTYFDNPYFTLLENRNSFIRDRLFGNILLRYQVSQGLSLQLRSGMDNKLEDRDFRRAFSSNRFKQGAYAEQMLSVCEINTDLLLNFSKTIDKFGLDLNLGGNRMSQRIETEQVQVLSLAQPAIFSLANGASPPVYFQNLGRKQINSLYGLAKLSLHNFLFVDLTGRNDWSSALATPTSVKNTSFFYPSISGGLVISDLIKMPRHISFLKIRTSVAQVGNDTRPFQTAGFFVPQTAVGGQPAFSDQSSLPNASLLPEIVTSKEIGADFRLYNDKLKFDFTYFNSLSKNQIILQPIAESSGYTEQNLNGGTIRNEGFEAVMSYTGYRPNKLKWNISLNFSSYRSTLESIPNSVEIVTLAYNRVYDNVNQTVWYLVKKGGRLGDMYGTGYMKNAEGQFILNASGNYIANNTLIKLGNYNPKFMLGLVNSLQYKSWNFSMVLDWRHGGQIVSRTQALAAVAGQLKETAYRPEAGIVAEGVHNVGTPEDPVYKPNTIAISAESYYRQFYDRNHEENNTLDASYLKFREMQVSYDIPVKFGANKIEHVSIALVGRNLLALSKIRHFDPEQVAFQGQNVLLGVEDMAYPSARSVGLKLAIQF